MLRDPWWRVNSVRPGDGGEGDRPRSGAAAEAGVGRGATARPAALPPDRRTGYARILLAEDEEHLGAILEMFLAGRGHDVTRVQDGVAALASFRERAYDVALLDVVMPGMDGLEVLGALASLPAPPEAIVMTGNGTVDTALTAIGLGAYDYLSKPYRMAEVELLIGRAVEKRRLRLAAACGRWAVAYAPSTFLTDDPKLRALLDDAMGAAREDATRPWLLSGPVGSGHETLARWLWAGLGCTSPPLAVRGSGDAVDDARSLFGQAGGDPDVADGAGDAALGALEAAGDGLVIVSGWERLAPSVRSRLGEAVERRAFQRGAEAEGALVQLGAHVCVCAEDGGAVHAGIASTAVRVDVPPLDERPMDIPLLARHLLRGTGAGPIELDDGALTWIAGRRWPGGAAQLRDVLAAAAWRAMSLPQARDEARPAVLSARELGAAWPLPGGALDQSYERRE